MGTAVGSLKPSVQIPREKQNKDHSESVIGRQKDPQETRSKPDGIGKVGQSGEDRLFAEKP